MSASAKLNESNKQLMRAGTKRAAIDSIEEIKAISELEGYTLIESIEGIPLIDSAHINDYIALQTPNVNQKEAVLLISGSELNGSLPLAANSYRGTLKRANFKVVKFKRSSAGLISSIREEGLKDEAEHFDFRSRFQRDLASYVKQAMNLNASDIHIEPRGLNSKDRGEIRFRINGDLIVQQQDISWEYGKKLLQYIYSMLGKGGDTSFHINEQQDAVIEKLPLEGLDKTRLRVATTPEADGIDMVLRVLPLNEKTKASDLSDLGYTERQKATILDALNAPSGLIVFAGQTGSGKTTSLAELCLTYHEKNNYTKKLITAEHPVEYKLPKTTQIPVQPKPDESAGEAWTRAIKAMMRLDPDALMVGEIRDIESASLIVQQVLTGHLSLSTLHAAKALSCIERLEGLGINRETIAMPGFIQILAKQDLIKKLCPHCSIPINKVIATPSLYKKQKPLINRLDEVVTFLGGDLTKVRFRNHQGCSYCSTITPGIKGMTCCAEVITPDKQMLELFKDQSKGGELFEYWLKNYPGEAQIDVAWQKVLEGLIAPEDAESKLNRFDQIIKRNNNYGVA